MHQVRKPHVVYSSMYFLICSLVAFSINDDMEILLYLAQLNWIISICNKMEIDVYMWISHERFWSVKDGINPTQHAYKYSEMLLRNHRNTHIQFALPFPFSGTPPQPVSCIDNTMLLYLTMMALCVALHSRTAQTVSTEAPFDGLVPQSLEPNIEFMRLFKLSIPVLDNSSFVRYSNLTKILMTWCAVAYVKDGTFDTLWRLQYVYFMYNEIIEFPENFGLASKSIVEMNLWDAFSLRNLPPFYFRNFSKLVKLKLGYNDWTPFDPSILPVSLNSINLNYASWLTTFPNFTGWTPNLKGISIEGNIIPDIPQENIQTMTITYINIGRNRLTSIPDYTAYSHIKVLLLHNNRLTTIPDFYNTTLKQLKLANNPLVCDNSLCWIRMWPWMFDTSLLLDTPTCASPANAAGKPLMTIRPIHMECFNGKLVLQLGQQALLSWLNMILCNDYAIPLAY